MGEVKADFDNPDENQASYLISPATNELCPVLITQLRTSAAQLPTTSEMTTWSETAWTEPPVAVAVYG